MATDLNAAKSALVTDSALPSTKTTAHNSSSGIDFSDIIRKTGNRLENGLHLLSDRAGIMSISERTDNTTAADDYSYDERDNRNENTQVAVLIQTTIAIKAKTMVLQMIH